MVDDIDRIMNGYNMARLAADFVDSVSFETEQMTGTRYKIIITEEETHNG